MRRMCSRKTTHDFNPAAQCLCRKYEMIQSPAEIDCVTVTVSIFFPEILWPSLYSRALCAHQHAEPPCTPTTKPASSRAAATQRAARERGSVEHCRRFGYRIKGPFAAVHESLAGPLQMPRPGTVASGYWGPAVQTLTFDCNSHCINQKDA
jgi:hypothetical protein